MERFIDLLRESSANQTKEQLLSQEKKEGLVCHNPSVVCCITMGKEIHAGHLFLLTVADQVRSGLKSDLPLLLVNNNTGPRAAGALSTIATRNFESLESAAEKLTIGDFTTSEIVSAYRSRNMNAGDLAIATELLSSGKFDIFSRVASETTHYLRQGDFDVSVISEASLLSEGLAQTEAVNPVWEGTGFVPFTDNKRVVILEKSGTLTATGSLFTSVTMLARRVNSDFVVTVDSMPDARDALFAYSNIEEGKSGTQLPGAGVGFGGKIASGTSGEALTVREIVEQFQLIRPGQSLRQATLFLTYTRPLSLPPTDDMSLGSSFYDFKDNEAMLGSLVSCSDAFISFKQQAIEQISTLSGRITESSLASSKASRDLLQFLPQKSVSLFQTDKEKVLGMSRKFIEIKENSEIEKAVDGLGYETRDNPYTRGERRLAVRGNFYFDALSKLMKQTTEIESLTQFQFDTILSMLQFCIDKSGL